MQAISEELLRLKAEGESSVPVTDETLASLRALVKARASASAPAASVAPAAPTSVATPPPAQTRPAEPDAPAAARPAPAVMKPLPAAAQVASLPPPPVVQLPPGDKATRWAALKQLATTHPVCLANVRPGKKAVLGVGALDAQIFFVGEAPGAEEEVAGEPFVGPAGQLLTKMIGGMGLKREQVYIGNILCWRPQMPTPDWMEQIGNRPPTPEEMAFCLPFLRASIEIVRPALIVALGGTAAQGLLGTKFTTLAAARSRWHEFDGTPLMVTYHPSYLLRSGTTKSKRAVWEDLLQVMERAGLPISDKQRGYFLEK
ncbi:MAG: uracil-DNA glycosylase [Opitutaceae bacterium]|nr:uracil-DNA glycosylase [Opitutaceae bacterium]